MAKANSSRYVICCERCGKRKAVAPSTEQRFCSAECFNSTKREIANQKTHGVCRNCGVVIPRKKMPCGQFTTGRRKYCSFACRNECIARNARDNSLSLRAINQPGVKERYWSFVEKTDDCWLWRGNTNNGYGNFSVGSYRMQKAHRVSYVIKYGDFDSSLFVCHRCDNPICVRPDHLFLGTHADNMRDMAVKGRHVSPYRGKPELVASAKLTWDKVDRIRESARNGMTHAELSTEYGVARAQITRIVSGDRWKQENHPNLRG